MWWLLIGVPLAFVGWIGWADYHRGRRRGQLQRALQEAAERHDLPTVAATARALLGYLVDRRWEQRVRLLLGQALGRIGDHPQAVAELRLVDEGFLYPNEKARLHNGLAYHLAQTGQLADALAAVKRAEEFLAMPVVEEKMEEVKTTSAAVRGTRGIIHFLDGKLDDAERDLQSALQMQPDSMQRAALDAERWWWLAEIARERGDGNEARLRLENAAAYLDTEFGSRAAVALGRPGGELIVRSSRGTEIGR